MKELVTYLKQNGLYDPETVEKFEKFFSLLSEYNEKFNLTAITDETEIEIKHFIDSLAGNAYLSENNLDIGSGAGFPGIPLAIVNPDKNFTLVDSLRKRVDFLSAVKEECSLGNLRVFHKRAEELDKNEKYGLVTARAVAPLNVLCEYCLPFVKSGGIMLAYKGRKADEEIDRAEKAIEILGGKVEKKVSYELNISGEEAERALIIIRKIKETPEKYPRGGNKPRLKPL